LNAALLPACALPAGLFTVVRVKLRVKKASLATRTAAGLWLLLQEAR
jgi:hypothetical protein